MIPQAYQQGFIEFYKLKFKVGPAVLIPRPETELLVDKVIENLIGSCVVVDVGTGSGCIAISIARNRSNAQIYAMDTSVEALKIAKLNARLNFVDKQINFIQSDLLADFDKQADIIVANLPYLPSQRIAQLDPSVKDFEPHLALDGGTDGLRLYDQLFSQIVDKNLRPKLIICEIDDDQADEAVKLAQKYFLDYQVKISQDLAKKDRILEIKLTVDWDN